MATDRTTHLQPFTKGDPRAVEAGRKGAETRRAKRDAAALVSVKDADAGAHMVQRLMTRYERGNLGPVAAAAAQHVIAGVATGAIPMRNGSEAADFLRVVFDMARLEEGQHTSATLHASVDTAALVARIEALREGTNPPPVEVEAKPDQGGTEPNND